MVVAAEVVAGLGSGGGPRGGSGGRGGGRGGALQVSARRVPRARRLGPVLGL